MTELIVKELFRDHKTSFSLNPWPQLSPDFNGIENLWDMLQKTLCSSPTLSSWIPDLGGGGVGLGLDCRLWWDHWQCWLVENLAFQKECEHQHVDHVKDSLIMYRWVTQTVVAVCRWHYFNTASGFCKEVLYVVFSLFSVAEAKMKNQLQHNHELEYTTTFLTLTPAVIIHYWVVIMKEK